MESKCGTYFLCALLLLLQGATILCQITAPSCLSDERRILLQLKHAHRTPALSSWTGDDCCQWKGVRCDNRTSHVTHLDLHDFMPRSKNCPKEMSSLSCLVHSDELWSNGDLNPIVFELKHLKYLDLNSNLFGGVIPEGLFELKELQYLDVSFNMFEGVIPLRIASLANLTHLDLTYAGFHGFVRLQIGSVTYIRVLDLMQSPSLSWARNLSELRYLALGGVSMSHTAGHNWAESISHLHNLHYLDLSDCQLSGPIPVGLRNLSSLTHLDLSLNELLTSAIPAWVGNMTTLVSLRLHGCNVSGQFPLFLSRLPRLKELSLSGNHRMTGNASEILGSGWPHLTTLELFDFQLTGNLPSSISNISTLTDLVLTFNELEGSIPSSIGNLSALRRLYLAENLLSGEIPMSLGQLSSLTYLTLSSNKLTGSIPTSIGHLSHLQHLGLSNNQLQGNLPVSHLQNLTALEYITVSSNSLEGNISLSAFDQQQYFHSLRYLYLSNNKFSVYIHPAWIPLPTFEGLGLSSCNIGPVMPHFLSTLYNIGFLELSNNDLSGSIPTWLADLPLLDYLNLSHNNLEGPLPQNLILSKYRVLDLHNNQLNGTLPIPNSLSCNRLHFLDLSQNHFNGHLPHQIGNILPSLEFLSLSANNLTGAIPFSIGNVQDLHVLDLSSNHFSGELPWRSIFNCSYLSVLNLANIGLEGHIPSNIGRGLTRLQTLHLENNEFKGTFPLALQNCTELQILDIGNNRFSGEIPSWLVLLSQLKILVLRSNQFEGGIPSEISHLQNLQILDLSHNNLQGTIPPSLGKLHAMAEGQFQSHTWESANTSYYYREQTFVIAKGQQLLYENSILLLMTLIDLSDNQLTGKIPSEIGGLKGLHALNISENNLVGQIPPSLGHMEQLESLDLSHNKLCGTIPFQMLQLNFLEFFIVSDNRLSGRIPSGGQFWTFPASFFANNPDLCGFPLEKKCEIQQASGMIPASPSLETEEEEEGMENTWYWYVSLMASFAAGFWGVWVVILANSGWRRRYFQVIDKIIIDLVNKVKG